GAGPSSRQRLPAPTGDGSTSQPTAAARYEMTPDSEEGESPLRRAPPGALLQHGEPRLSRAARRLGGRPIPTWGDRRRRGPPHPVSLRPPTGVPAACPGTGPACT